MQTFTTITTPQYYDSENITESRLSFRRATSEPQTHRQDDDVCMKLLYDMDWYVALHQYPSNSVN